MVYFDLRRQKYSILMNITASVNNLWPITYFSYGKSWPSKDYYDLEKKCKSVTTNLAFAVICK